MESKKLTVRQIAASAGISPATVSRVLTGSGIASEASENKVRLAIKELGGVAEEYILPRIQKGIQPTILVNIPSMENPFYTDIIQAIRSCARSHGFRVLVSMSELDAHSIDDFLRLLESTRAQGVILLNGGMIEALNKINNIVPAIQCCEFNPASPIPYVGIDDKRSARNAVDYLISCGRKRIAFINGPLNYKFARERRAGYLEALEAADIIVPGSWMVNLTDISYDMAYAWACQILSNDVVPDAFFTISDEFAAAVIRAASKYHYKTPDDIIVMGFDNISLSAMFTPSITTMAQPKTSMGYSACEMLISKINDPLTNPTSILFDTELIVRESTLTIGR